jgi:hypothetical protein
MVPEMADDFPDGVPLLSLLSIPEAPVPEEAAHLKGSGDGGKFANPLEVHRCIASDTGVHCGQNVHDCVHHAALPCAACLQSSSAADTRPTSCAPVCKSRSSC